MADELVEILRNFDLSNKEKEQADTKSGKEECKTSLFGKVIGDRMINATGVKKFISQVWDYPK